MGPFLRAWRYVFQLTPDLRGKSRVLWRWPGRLVRRWPTDVSIASREGCVFLHCDLNEYLYQVLFFLGLQEADVDWMCGQLLRPGDVFVDIGACYGYHALTNARRVGPRGRAYALEPQPDVFTALLENALSNGLRNLEADSLALSDQAERLELHRFSGLGIGHTSIATLGHSVFEVLSCEAVTLDEFLARKGIGHVALLKLDVEGAELKVLRGAGQLLNSPSPPMWIVEVNVETAGGCGYCPGDIVALLAGFGYRSYRPVWGKAIRRVQRVEPCPPDQVEHGQNLLYAIPSVHAEALRRVGVT